MICLRVTSFLSSAETEGGSLTSDSILVPEYVGVLDDWMIVLKNEGLQTEPQRNFWCWVSLMKERTLSWWQLQTEERQWL